MLARKTKEQLALLAIMGVLALSGWLAVRTIRIAQVPVDITANPSPHGYTWSLALFLVPMTVLGVWVLRFSQRPTHRKAFLLTIAVLIPLGFALDLFFGLTFFKFPNHEATLGINLPGYRFGQGWSLAVPLEEFVFYAAGFITILLTYVWAEAVMFAEFKVEDAYRTPRVFQSLPRSLATWLVAGAVLFGIAWVIRNTGSRAGQGAFPGYFLFLLVGSVLPGGVCSPVAFRFINWRALTVAYLFILLVSQFWEASLGLPYQWWDYQPGQMMGLFLKPFCNLPLEAVLVWTFATWTTVILYETILVALVAGRKGFGILSILVAEEQEVEETQRRVQDMASPPPNGEGSNSRSVERGLPPLRQP